MTLQNVDCTYNHEWGTCPIRFSCDDGEDCMEAYEDKEELRQKNKRNSK